MGRAPRPRSAPVPIAPTASGPSRPWAPSRAAGRRPWWWPNRPSRWSWWGRPRAGRPAPWPCRPSWGGRARWWRPASRATFCDTRGNTATDGARSGASIRPGRPGHRPANGPRWRVCSAWPGARRMAADLCETAKADGTTADGEFWYATAAKLLAPLLFAAAVRGGSMADVVRWVDTQEVGEVSDILETGRAARSAGGGARLVVPGRTDPQFGVHHGRDRPGSVRGRGRAAPRSGGSTRATSSTGRHTVYLCAPAHDQRSAARLLHRPDHTGALAGVRPVHAIGSAPRPTAARRAR